ncbi:MAG: deoxyribose-phosphate aldolase, partial [Promethearchaeota archaeon]
MELKNLEDLAKIIDHTNLKAFSTTDDIKQLCDEAKEYSFGAVCINPVNVSLAKEYLKGTDVKVCTVIGFPLGATTSEVKAFEAEQAIDNGATEVDMVINIGALKSKNYDMVKDDISAVVNVVSKKAKEKNAEIICKVILETCYLSDEEIIKAC